MFHCFAWSFACWKLCGPEDRIFATQRTARYTMKHDNLNCGQPFRTNHAGKQRRPQSRHRRTNWSAKHTRPTSKINRTSWLNVISLLPQVFSIVPKSHYILFWIFMYLCVSSYIFMYLFVSLCIFTYLYVSLCIFLFLTYLYVSLCIFPTRSGRYVRSFTYLYVSFKTVPEDTYVSLRIFYVSFQPVSKDT